MAAAGATCRCCAPLLLSELFFGVALGAAFLIALLAFLCLHELRRRHAANQDARRLGRVEDLGSPFLGPETLGSTGFGA